LKPLLTALFTEASAGEDAESLGLTHKGWGRYYDAEGNLAAKSINGKLVKVDPNDDENHDSDYADAEDQLNADPDSPQKMATATAAFASSHHKDDPQQVQKLQRMQKLAKILRKMKDNGADWDHLSPQAQKSLQRISKQLAKDKEFKAGYPKSNDTMHKVLDWEKEERKARSMTSDQLEYAIKDAWAASKASGRENPNGEGFYADQAMTYAKELMARRAGKAQEPAPTTPSLKDLMPKAEPQVKKDKPDTTQKSTSAIPSLRTLAPRTSNDYSNHKISDMSDDELRTAMDDLAQQALSAYQANKPDESELKSKQHDEFAKEFYARKNSSPEEKDAKKTMDKLIGSESDTDFGFDMDRLNINPTLKKNIDNAVTKVSDAASLQKWADKIDNNPPYGDPEVYEYIRLAVLKQLDAVTQNASPDPMKDKEVDGHNLDAFKRAPESDDTDNPFDKPQSIPRFKDLAPDKYDDPEAERQSKEDDDYHNNPSRFGPDR